MDSNLQHRLYHFETNPPEEVWDKIADSLDAAETFPQRLFDYEVQPPVKTWTVIEASLEQKATPAKIVLFPKPYNKPLRYIAAASIIAIILAITTLGSREAVDGTTQATTETKLPINQSSILPTPKKPVLVEEREPAPSVPVTTAASTEKPEKASRRPNIVKRALAYINPPKTIHQVSLSGNFIPNEAGKEQLFDFSRLDHYMVYNDGNGMAIKVPKKLFSLVNCKDGDGSCQERIHQLRQKLTANNLSTDFAGLLEIVRQLQ